MKFKRKNIKIFEYKDEIYTTDDGYYAIYYILFNMKRFQKKGLFNIHPHLVGGMENPNFNKRSKYKKRKKDEQ